MLYISTGLVFMLASRELSWGSGTCWRSAAAARRILCLPTWIQAHGHAQIFGWIGTFILGIGFYSIPKLRRMNPFELSAVWVCWAIWTSGVTLRWLTGVYQWQWRVLLPCLGGTGNRCLRNFLRIPFLVIARRTLVNRNWKNGYS